MTWKYGSGTEHLPRDLFLLQRLGFPGTRMQARCRSKSDKKTRLVHTRTVLVLLLVVRLLQ